MKRTICMFLIAMMVFSMFGCGKTQEQPEETNTGISAPDGTFQVGFGRQDITPEISVPLSGYGNTSMRMSTGILQRIYVSAVAMRDETGNTILLMSADLGTVSGWLNGITSTISDATGVPSDHIIFSATHTHSSPATDNVLEPNMQEYAEETLVPGIQEAALQAMQDLKTAEISTGSIETEHMNFIRHYTHIDENGEKIFFGDNFGTAVYDETTDYATQMDETMYVMKVSREGEKDVVMVNWRAHPHFDSIYVDMNAVSSDWVGGFRDAVELSMDCNFVYYQGAAGNNNAFTRLAKDSRTKESTEFGAIMAGYVKQCLENNMKPLKTGVIETRQTVMDGKVNHTMDHMVTTAKGIQAIWNTTNDSALVVEAGKPYGIRSPYHANAIVANYDRPEILDIELNAFTIGEDMAFVSAPNELYDTLSVMTEEGSPYETTWTIGYANAHRGYIPSAYGWEYTSYESDVSLFMPGTGEEIVDCFLKMLNEMNG